jgi:excisionase family DNA binding protein
VTGKPSPASAPFLTIFQVASVLRVSKRTVYHLVHTGDLEAVRAGKSYLIPGHALRPHASVPSGKT